MKVRRHFPVLNRIGRRLREIVAIDFQRDRRRRVTKQMLNLGHGRSGHDHYARETVPQRMHIDTATVWRGATSAEACPSAFENDAAPCSLGAAKTKSALGPRGHCSFQTRRIETSAARRIPVGAAVVRNAWSNPAPRG